MELRYRLTRDDYAAFNDARGALRRRFGQPPPIAWYGIGVLGLAVLALRFTLSPAASALADPIAWVSLAVTGYAFTAPSLYIRVLERGYRRNGLGLCEVGLELVAEGLRLCAEGKEGGTIPFTAIRSVEDFREHVFLWLDAKQAVILPKRACKDTMRLTEFVEAVEKGRRDGRERRGSAVRQHG